MNIDICRVSKDLFDKDINLLVQDAEKQDQSGKENNTANYLHIFEEINTKMIEDELGPAISNQLMWAKMAMKYWSKKSRNPLVVNKILDGFKFSTNCRGVRVPIY